MISLNSFDIRARTIDHLGRGQIADAPTAVSELWKNSYDAYSKKAELTVYCTDSNVAVVADDGSGMTAEDIVKRWLVLGTESKYNSSGNEEAEETFGLPQRVKQGEKGIGRLSAAFLAPITLLVTKKENSKIALALVDWRLFENPYVSILDIKIPILELESINYIEESFRELKTNLLHNLGVGRDERSQRLKAAWEAFSKIETNAKVDSTTYERILKSHNLNISIESYIPSWNLKHGTTLVLLETYDEISDIERFNESKDDPNIDNFKRTLTAFIDPYTDKNIHFKYRIRIFSKDGQPRVFLKSDTVFGKSDFDDLEHRFIGKFTGNGEFIGEVVAFGIPQGVFKFRPKQINSKSLIEIGPFDICIGSFEFTEKNSSITKEQRDKFDAQAEQFGGIFVYRDSMRVLPYGRPEADFLELEKRRSMHAGENFFSHRRTFGRIAITKELNPALKDKAGREGIVVNRQYRAFRAALIEFLKAFAKKYVGTKSETKQNFLSQKLEEKKREDEEKAHKLRLERRKLFREEIRANSKKLDIIIDELSEYNSHLKIILSGNDKNKFEEAIKKVSYLRSKIAEFIVINPPEDLGSFEEVWREYRDKASYAYDVIKIANEKITVKSKLFQKQDEFENELKKKADEKYSEVIDKVSYYFHRSSENVKSVIEKLYDQFLDDLKADFALDLDRSQIQDRLYSLYNDFDLQLENIRYSLEHLANGTNLKRLIQYNEDKRVQVQNELADIRAVAQVGITVEIIGHELASLEAEVKGSLRGFPQSIKESSSYKHSIRALNALTDRLRFLSPMKIAGYQPKEMITGLELFNYLVQFFKGNFERNKIEFSSSDAFKAIRFESRPSRIYPAIVNIVNNAAYWVKNAEKPKICLDYKNGKVLIANNGPSVDIDDVDHLFDLFFTTRSEGRGVGLYLAKVNLESEGHNLEYVTEPTFMIFKDGTNFEIAFKGVK